MGGKNEMSLVDDVGPWNEYDLIDNHEPGTEVGIRRKDRPNS